MSKEMNHPPPCNTGCMSQSYTTPNRKETVTSTTSAYLNTISRLITNMVLKRTRRRTRTPELQSTTPPKTGLVKTCPGRRRGSRPGPYFCHVMTRNVYLHCATRKILYFCAKSCKGLSSCLHNCTEV